MNKKITFIIHSLDCGGAERVVSLLANKQRLLIKNYIIDNNSYGVNDKNDNN